MNDGSDPTLTEEAAALQNDLTDTGLPAEVIQLLSDEFDTMCAERHEMGAKKYGPVKFAEVDSIQMALEEITDLANYARYTFIKLRALQIQLAGASVVEQSVPDNQFFSRRKQ